MARTSKTVIGGGSGEQNDRMMRAAASGQEAVARERDRADALRRENQEIWMRTGESVAGGLQRQQQIDQQQAQFDQSMEQRRSETELEAAKSGFEPNTQQDPQSRAARLEAEMRRGEGQPQIGPLDAESQQRLNQQTSQGLEMDSQGRWRPTAERAAMKEREQRREDFQADTDRIKALAYRDQVGVAAQKALVAGDKKAYEENVKRLVATPNDMQKRYDRLMKMDVNSNDWSELSELAKGSEEMDPTLQADLKAKQFTPRVAAFVRAMVQKDALQSIVLSKGNTSMLEVDWTAPKMREFQAEVQNINDFMRSNPALGQLAFINSTDDKMRFLNVLAASKVLMGMTQPPPPSGGMMPATQGGMGGQGAPAPGQEQMVPPGGTQVPGRAEGAAAVQQARQGGASPQQALEAGQQVNPTGQFGNPPLRQVRR